MPDETVFGKPRSDDKEFVDCDEGCLARRDPDDTDIQQLRDALDHWKNHDVDAGCSHGR